MLRNRLVGQVGLLVFLSAACSNQSSPSGTGGTAGSGGEVGGSGGGGGTTDSAPKFPPGFSETRLLRGDGAEADLSCLGKFEPPAGGTPLDLNLAVTLSSNGEPVPSATIHFFPKNEVTPGACEASQCVSITTDSAGKANIAIPAGGFYGFEVPKSNDLARTIQVNALAPADDAAPTFPVIVTSQGGFTLLSVLASFESDPVKPVIAGTLRDCEGQLLQNVIVSVVTPDGVRIEPRSATPAETEPGTIYFAPSTPPLPDPKILNGTRENGRFTTGNLAIDARPYRVESWAVIDKARGPELLGCEEAYTYEETISIVTLWPLRAKYPDGHACE
jgi:hypothetical protein